VRVVKSFEDPEFLKAIYGWVSDKEVEKDHFYWGLGDDGGLYLSCSRFRDNDYWHKLEAISNIEDHLSIRVMKRIVKEFGHLVIFT
jgi:hypothetical protein